MKKLGGVFVVACVVGWAGAARAGALDKPAFTATPAELLAAAAPAATADADVVLLRRDVVLTFDAAGRAERRNRDVFVVLRTPAIDEWGAIGLEFSPYYQDRPVIRARVIAPGGAVAELDPALVTDAPSVSESPTVYSDRRDVRAPLPRLAIGSVVEKETVVRDREPLLAAGVVEWTVMSAHVPVTRTTLVISAPVALPVTVRALGFATAPTPRRATERGRASWSFDLGPTAVPPPFASGLPADIVPVPVVGVATGASWGAVTDAYRALVDQRLAAGPVTPAPDLRAATERETIDRTLAWVHAHVRYTGIELSDAAIVPATPADTLARGFGDCKDQATLLVALLRGAGIRADLVLLDTGPGFDLTQAGLPGMGSFDHAIVRARGGGGDVWIDATEPELPAGQLPARDQGRRALVVAADARDLTPTPAAPAGDNLVREVRTYHLAEQDRASVTEVSTETGAFYGEQGAWARDKPRADVTKALSSYVKEEYDGTLRTFSVARGAPLALTVEVDKTSHAFTERATIDVYLNRAVLFRKTPEILKSTEAAQADLARARTVDFEWTAPYTAEVEHRLEAPSGYVIPPLPPTETIPLGTMTLRITRRTEGETYVITERLESGKRRMTAAELRDTRTAVTALLAQPRQHVALALRSASLMAAGKGPEAAAEAQRLIALHPKEAIHWGQLAEVYQRAGLGPAARRAARKGVAIEPKSGDAHYMLAWTLHQDSFGREGGADADRDGAIAEARAAIALRPDHKGALELLADLVSRDRSGRPGLVARDHEEAAALLRRVNAAFDSHDEDRKIVFHLLMAGRGAEAEPIARGLSDDNGRAGLTLAAVALARGSAAAVAEAPAVAATAKHDSALAFAMAVLVMARRYDLSEPLAAALHDPSVLGAAAIMGAHLTAIRVDALDPADPRTPYQLLLLSFMQGAPRTPWSAELGRRMTRNTAGVLGKSNEAFRDLAPAVAADLVLAAIHWAVEGSAAEGWRVSATARPGSAAYVELRNGVATLIGSVEDPIEVGELILSLLAKGDLAGATRWYQRVIADVQAGGPGTPLLRIHSVATAGGQAPSRDLIEFAAALMASSGGAARALTVLQRCAVPEELKVQCRAGAYVALVHGHRFAEAAEVARDELGAGPAHRASARGLALAKAGKVSDAIRELDAALAQSPDDRTLLWARAEVTAPTDWAATGPWLDKLVASPQARATDFNAVAWLRLYHDATPEQARAAAAAGERGGPLEPDFANTIAAIEAESDHPAEAWRYLKQSIARDPTGVPVGADWYVHGRIAESYGLRDDAIADYKRVPADPPDATPPTGYLFARRRLAHLGVK